MGVLTGLHTQKSEQRRGESPNPVHRQLNGMRKEQCGMVDDHEQACDDFKRKRVHDLYFMIYMVLFCNHCDGCRTKPHSDWLIVVYQY